MRIIWWRAGLALIVGGLAGVGLWELLPKVSGEFSVIVNLFAGAAWMMVVQDWWCRYE